MSVVFSTPADETAGTDETGAQPSVFSSVIGALPGSAPQGSHIGSPSNGTVAPATFALTETAVPA